MVELSCRLLLAGLLVFVSGLTGIPAFDVAWKVGALMGAMAVFTHLISNRGYRTPAVAAILACIDSAMIGVVLGSILNYPALESAGVMMLAPCLYAAWKHGSNGLLMAPVVASSLVLCDSAFHFWEMPPNKIFLQAAAILCVGLLIRPAKSSGRILASTSEEIAGMDQIQQIQMTDQLVEVRESYRQLRDAYRDMERKTKKDRVTAALADARAASTGTVLKRMLDRLVSLTGASGAVLYTVAQYADSLVVKATSGSVSEQQEYASLEVSTKQAIALIQERADRLTSALQTDKLTRNLVIHAEGKVVGLLTLSAETDDQLLAAMEGATVALSSLALTIQEEHRRENVERRLRETEALYAVVAITDGATSKAEVASRLVQDLMLVLEADHAGVFAIDGTDLVQVAQQGKPVRLIEEMSFAQGKGVEGWVKIGAPELNMPDVRTDQRFPAEVSLKARIGSYLIQPIFIGSELFGFMSAATSRVGALDIPQVETMRAAAAELSRLLSRLSQSTDQSEGILTPKQFSTQVAEKTGYVVTLDPLRLTELENKFGKPAMSHALRQLGLRIRARVPQGAIVCRHPNNMFLVFMETEDGSAVMSWANEMAAIGPQIGIRTPDGSTRIPIAIRAKVAQFSPQNNQVLSAA